MNNKSLLSYGIVISAINRMYKRLVFVPIQIWWLKFKFYDQTEANLMKNCGEKCSCQNGKNCCSLMGNKKHLPKGREQNLLENWVSKQRFFCFDIDNGPKFFCLSRWKDETFWFSLNLNFVKPHKISTHLAFSDNCYFHSFFIGCLIELKFCEVSRNSISNWTWKFQLLSILKNKKSFIPEKNIFWAVPPRYIQKMALAVSIF